MKLIFNHVSDVPLSCRPAQISQILIGNSYDAIQNLEEKWVRIEILRENNMAKIIVRDSGTGIPDTVRAKLMTPFFTTKGGGKGTGLGLSIARGLDESHGGSLELKTDAKNTTFVFSMPISEVKYFAKAV